MSTPDILGNMSRGWNRSPTGFAAGSLRTGISAGFWKVDDISVHEIAPEAAELTTHIVAVIQSTFDCETTFDGVVSSRGTHAPGMITMVPAGRRPRAVIAGRHAILHFYVPHAYLTDLAQHTGGQSAGGLEMIDPGLAHDPLISALGREVLSEMREGQLLSRLRVDALGQNLAIHLLRRWSNLAGAPTTIRELAKGGLAPWQVKRTTEYMEDRLAEDVSLEDLSQLLDLSTFHLCRAFKQSTGLPPHRWRHQRRIDRARELLEGTDLPVTEVAARVGYDDPSQLAAAFRKATGLSPTQYRRERRT